MKKLFLILILFLPVLAQAQSSTFTPVCSGSAAADMAKFTSYINSTGSNNVTIHLPYKATGSQACTFNTNFTIPARVSIDNTDGTALRITAGTLTFEDGNSLSVNGPQRLFVLSGAGTVRFNKPPNVLYPEWWGGKGDGTAAAVGATDNLTAANAMMASISNNLAFVFNGNTKIVWSKGRIYDFSDTFEILTAVEMDCGGSWGWQPGATLRWPVNKVGLRVNALSTFTGNATGGDDARWTTIHGCGIQGGTFLAVAPTTHTVDVSGLTVTKTAGANFVDLNGYHSPNTITINSFPYQMDAVNSTTEMTILRPRVLVHMTNGSTAIEHYVEGTGLFPADGAWDSATFKACPADINQRTCASTGTTYTIVSTTATGGAFSSGTAVISPAFNGTTGNFTINLSAVSITDGAARPNLYHGIDARGPVHVYDNYIKWWTGNGISLDSAVGQSSFPGAIPNTNISKISANYIYFNNGNGIATRGLNSNQSLIENNNATANMGCGHAEFSFLGNNYLSNHTDANGRAGTCSILGSVNVSSFLSEYSEGTQPSSFFGQNMSIDKGNYGAGVSLADSDTEFKRFTGGTASNGLPDNFISTMSDVALGNIGGPVKTITFPGDANYQLTQSDQHIIVEGAAGNINFLDPTLNTGRQWTIQRGTTSSGTVSFFAPSGAFQVSSLTGVGDSVTLISDGTDYIVKAVGGATSGSGALLRALSPTFTATTGTAPFVTASTTNVPNLNASFLGGATFAAPGAIGGTTPSTGAFTFVSVQPTAGSTGELRLLEIAANGTNYMGWKSPTSIAANVIWTLPGTDGTNGQIMQTNGAGVLSWAANAATGMSNPMTTTGDIIYSSTTAAPGAPARLAIGTTGQCLLTSAGGLPEWGACSGSTAAAGSDTQVQVNIAGSLGADAGFIWNNTSKAVTLSASFVGVKVPLLLRNTNNGTGSTTEFHIGNDAATDTFAFKINSSTFTSENSTASIFNRQNAALAFGTNNTERARIAAGGAFTMTSTLDVAGHGAMGADASVDQAVGASSGPELLNIRETLTAFGSDTKASGVFTWYVIDPSDNQVSAHEIYGQRAIASIINGSVRTYAGKLYGQVGESFYGGTATLAQGVGVYGDYNHNGTGTTTTAYGVEGLFQTVAGASCCGTVTNAVGVRARFLNNSATTITNARGLSAGIDQTAAGAIDTAYSLQATTPTNSGGGTIATLIGLRINDHSGVTGVTTARNLDSLGVNSINYFQGSVGIGTTTPATSLVVTPSVTGGGIRIDGASGSISPSLRVDLNSTQYATLGTVAVAGHGFSTSAVGDVFLKNQQLKALLFGTNGTEYMRITSTGSVGIGTTAPATTLEVAGTMRGALQDKGGQLFNCKAYGAVGDGVTDDTSAITTCLAAAAGKVAFFPAGTYLTDVHAVSTAGSVVQGAGRGVTTLKRKDNSTDGGISGALLYLSGARITVKDLSVNGNCANPSNPSGPHSVACTNQSDENGGEIECNGANCTVDNVDITNSMTYSVAFYGLSSSGVVKNSTLTGSNAVGALFGVNIDETVGDVDITDNVISYYKLNAAASNVRSPGPGTTRYLDNTFIGNAQAEPGGQTYSANSGDQIIGNRYRPGTSTYISASGIEKGNGGIVSGNIVIAGPSNVAACIAIQFQNSGQALLVYGNTCKDFDEGLFMSEDVATIDYVSVFNNDFQDGIATAFSIGVMTGTHFSIANNFGSTTWNTSGTGAPSGACVSGSIYSRTDGTGSSLYACRSSVWTALN